MDAFKNYNFCLRTRSAKIKKCSIRRVCEHFLFSQRHRNLAKRQFFKVPIFDIAG